MHVLFISNLYPRPDEPQRGLFNAALIRAMVPVAEQRGLGVEVLVPVATRERRRFPAIRGWTVPEREACDARVTYLPYQHIPYLGRPLAVWFCRRGLHPVAARFERAAGVIGSWLYPDAVAAGQLAQAHGRPYLARLHGSDRFHLDAHVRGRAGRACLEQSTGIAVNAASMRTELMQRGIAAARIQVVPNGVDQKRFYPWAEKDRQQPAILWAGNLVPIKDPERALRVFGALCQTHPAYRSCRLLMAGEGPLRQHLQRTAVAWGLAQQVVFIGSLPPDALAERMRAARCLLLTSRSEGMPNVVLEAWASGTPVVTLAAGDTVHTVQDGVNGYCVPAGSQDEKLVEALASALQQDWDPQAIRASVAGYDWTQAAERLLAMLLEEQP